MAKKPALTDEQALSVIEQLQRETVTPKFNEWRNYHRVKLAYGGRGAGAKSRSSASLLLQFGEYPSYFGSSIRVLCVRNVQKSIAESSWRALKDELERLGYRGWKVTEDKIMNTKNGSYFTFSGLNSLTKDNLKSLSDYDILYAEEAAPISKDAWLTIQATFRKPMSELWLIYNRTLNMDPCHALFAVNPDPSWSIIACRPGKLDNPFFPDVLQKEWDRLKEIDPDEAMHVYEGLPRTQSDKAVFARHRIAGMFERIIEPSGAIEIGCDVARFGKDKTEAYKRHGLSVIDHKSIHGFGTVEVAAMLWEMAGKDTKIPIKVDSGYNPGVIDMLVSWGANVVSVGFGEVAVNKDEYPNAATEMVFELPVDEISMPVSMMTNTLIEDLTERYFYYDTAGRRKIEPKDGTSTTEEGASKQNFKGRHGGRSPDEGDALCLCFYNKNTNWELFLL